MGEDKKITKAQGFRMTLTAVLSYIPLIPVFWYLVQPVLIKAVSAAVADDIKVQVEQAIRPINSAFGILLQRDIDNKKRQIAALKNKRQFQPNEWTIKDAEMLVNYEIELESLIAAKKEL